MIVSVRELLDKGAWIGDVGKQQHTSEYEWNGFLMPRLVDVEIGSINMNGNMFGNLNEDNLFQGADMTLIFGDIKRSFTIVKSLVDENDTIDNYVEIPDHEFIGLEEIEIFERFVTDVKRILTDTWSGTNKVRQSQALRQHILKSPERWYFEENYPELLV